MILFLKKTITAIGKAVLIIKNIIFVTVCLILFAENTLNRTIPEREKPM